MNELLLKFKEKLNQGESVIGPFMKVSDPAFVEVAGYAGFDFVILDTEHGPGSIELMQNLIRAAIVAGVLPIIRVQDGSEASIGKALDIGALGIQVPQVQNGEEAKEIVKKAKFYPKGERGVCRFVRAANYSAMDRFEYFRAANDALVILQLEGQESIKNIDEILKVEGVDIVFIGPYDLSQSLGVPGEITNPIVIEKMQYIVDKAKEKNIIVGTFLDDIESIKRWKDAGILYLSYSVDVGIFLEACRSIVKSSRI
ncbi:MAG TPA: aldolase/citrate lyase family protein [Ruminiclostridium sp.]